MKSIYIFTLWCCLGLIQCSTASKTGGTLHSRRQNLSTELQETYWRLVELNGQPVKNPSPNQKETHLIFKKEGNRVQGNGGCNTLMGTYELLEGNRLHFSGVASTMMACMDMQTEDELKRVIEMTDHFAINGRVLFLQKAKMAPLAKFEAR